MEEKKEFKLFREKSLEAVESPESLNDYMRVTSPGIWLVLAAVIALLVGAVLWGIFGRIDTTLGVAESRPPHNSAARKRRKRNTLEKTSPVEVHVVTFQLAIIVILNVNMPLRNQQWNRPSLIVNDADGATASSP